MFKRLFSGSRMTRECPVRFCEGLSGKFRGSTHQKSYAPLFFPLLFIASVSVPCLADGPSTQIDEQKCSLARMSDEQIALQYEHIANQFQKSDKIRVCVKLGSYAVCAAAIAALCYELIPPTKSTIVPENLRACSLDQLVDLVHDLIERVRRLEVGPNLFSWEFVKSFFYSLLWSPSTILSATRFLLNQGQSYLNHELYAANLSWFINEKTRLGLLTKHEEPSTTNFEFKGGHLAKDIEQCAEALDGVTRGLLPTDIAYQKLHMAECCEAIGEDLSKLIAFSKYCDTVTDNEKTHLATIACSRYLINFFNSFIDKIEARLNGASDEKFLPLVQEFNTGLQPIIIRFAESIKKD